MTSYQKTIAVAGSVQEAVKVSYTAAGDAAALATRSMGSGGRLDGDIYFLRARLNVSLPGLEREVAMAIVDVTHGETCAYSNATRDNIDVTLNVM